MKRLLWIVAALTIALIGGACSNATDAARAAEEDLIAIVGEGLDLSTLSSLDDIFFSQRENISLKLGLEGASSLSIDPSGSLPPGLSMNSTGLITGTADTVADDVTASFTVVSNIGIETPLTWTLKAPRTQGFTADENWTVPDEPGYSANNTITLQVLLAGGGGAGGSRSVPNETNGGGGGGGQVVEGAIQVTPGESIAVVIGAGGAKTENWGYSNSHAGGPGGTTSFGSYLSAAGGGGGGGGLDPNPAPPTGGNQGGSPDNYGTGASGTDKNGKTSANSYNGNTVTLGGAGASVTGTTGGTGGGGDVNSNGTPSAGTPNTGGGGGGGTSGSGAGANGGSGVVYVNY